MSGFEPDQAATEELAALSREVDLSKARWDLAVTAAGMGTFELDARTGALEWDDRLVEIFGYHGRGAGEFDGSLAAVERRVHPEDMARVAAAIDEALATIGEIHVRYRVVLPDGRLRWLQARGRTIAGADGVAERMLGVTFDVTDQQDAASRTQHLLDSMAAGVIALDRDFVVTAANLAAGRITRVAASAMQGRTLWDLFPESVGTVFEQTYRRVLATRKSERIEAYSRPLDLWVDARVVPDDDGLLVTFVDVTAQHAVQDLLQLSVDVGEQLAAAPDIDTAVGTLIDAAIPLLADWAIVSLIEGGRVRDVRAAHAKPDLEPAVERYRAARLDNGGSGIVQEVIDTGVAQLISEVVSVGNARLKTDTAKTALVALGPGSVAVVPLLGGRGQVVGVLSLYRDAGVPALTAGEFALTESICRRAGLAVENRRLFAVLGEAAEHDRSVAQTLQQALLTRLPQIDGLHLAARYLPAADGDQVGGDWYDALTTADGTVALAIGDVVGHDIRAAGRMGQLRGALRTFAWDRGEPPARLLQRLDAAIAGMQLRALATVLAAQLEPASSDGARILRWSNAGHPDPFVLHPDGAVDVLWSTPRDLLLGVRPDNTRHDHVARLGPGSTLVLYTDGLVERRDEDLDAGMARLASSLTKHAALPLDALLDAVLADLVGTAAVDDVAVLAVRLR